MERIDGRQGANSEFGDHSGNRRSSNDFAFGDAKKAERFREPREELMPLSSCVYL
jgi:hypothetical protein